MRPQRQFEWLPAVSAWHAFRACLQADFIGDCDRVRNSVVRSRLEVFGRDKTNSKLVEAGVVTVKYLDVAQKPICVDYSGETYDSIKGHTFTNGRD